MSEIYNIIDKKKLDIVSKPIHEAHGLPNECYTSKEYTLIERKKLFEDKWIVIGVASALPEIGDAKPIDLLGIPIMILRDKKIKLAPCYGATETAGRCFTYQEQKQLIARRLKMMRQNQNN